MSRVVTAPLIIVTDDDQVRHHLYQGEPVPSYVRGAQLTHLRELGMVDDAPELPAEPEPEPEPEPEAKSERKASRHR